MDNQARYQKLRADYLQATEAFSATSFNHPNYPQALGRLQKITNDFFSFLYELQQQQLIIKTDMNTV